MIRLALLIAAAAAIALPAAAQNTVTITAPAGVTVKPTVRTTNTSKQVLVTINKRDVLTVNGKQVNPPPPPPMAMPFVDVARLMPTAAGFTDERVRTTFFDPTAWYDKATGLPAPQCTGWGTGCYLGMPAPACTTDGPHCARAPADTPSPSDIGSFREICAPSVMRQVDPIVAPGKPRSAHMHTFFGPPGVDENTTDPTALPSSTCAGGTINRTLYWVPTMVDTLDGRPIAPESLIAYYKLAYNGLKAGTLVPFPPGHRMVAGDPANAKPWGNPVRYLCVATNEWTPGIPTTCPAGSELWQEVAFKQCGDGRLDSPDHMSHMADPVGGACPASHPIAHAEVRYEVHYRVLAGDVTARWRLSSDMYDPSQPGGYSGHGDWFNGWKKETQQGIYDRCINGGFDCHANLLGDGRVLY